MGTTLRRDAERNRLRILDAARAVFAERGLGVTLDEIARRAGVGVGTVYRRFPNKEALIDALFIERIESLSTLAEAALTEPDPWHGFRMFVENALTLFAGDRALRDLSLGGGHSTDRMRVGRARLDPLLGQLIERAQAGGKLRADLHTTDMPLILLMIDSVIDAARQTAPEIWRRTLELIFDGLVVQRAAESPLRVPALAPDQLDEVLTAWRP